MAENENNSVNNEENEDDANVITLEEFIEEETRLETDAQAVLGPLCDKTCTYSQGYMGRQALYACKTCKSSSGKTAGVCLACTYHCHEGHDLIELYTKRNFRCDCGNSRFKDNKCNLEPIKDSENSLNRYNDNFDGLYCVCKRPYPDPQDSVPDDMIQCIVCEDWYHTRHLNAEMPGEDSYAEMICSDCTKKLPFINKYLGFSVTKVIKEESKIVDVGSSATDHQTSGDKKSNCDNSNSGDTKNNDDASTGEQNGGDNSSSIDTSDVNTTSGEVKPNGGIISSGDQVNSSVASTSGEVTHNEPSSQSKECLLESLSEVDRDKTGATFWPHNLRTLLCTCTTCKEMYRRLEVGYLCDVSDTVQYYEDKGRQASSSSSSNAQESTNHSLTRVLSMLSKIGMDRYSQAEAILNYNDLKSNLMKYLAKFAENKKVVREEDIHEFFSQMNQRKKQKLDNQTFTCR